MFLIFFSPDGFKEGHSGFKTACRCMYIVYVYNVCTYMFIICLGSSVELDHDLDPEGALHLPPLRPRRHHHSLKEYKHYNH